ncbi:MAG: carbohydrate binding domain-containing protein [Caldilineales bacterium]|nr:carbohydrate binding domain-containing protein [Caldilineales bacterium]
MKHLSLALLLCLTLLALLNSAISAGAPATAPGASPDAANLIRNGSFENGLQNWQLGLAPEQGATGRLGMDSTTKTHGLVSARATITRTKSDAPDWAVNLNQGGLALQAQRRYLLSFWAKSTGQRWFMGAMLGGQRSPLIVLGPAWRRYEAAFIFTQSNPNATLEFYLAGEPETMWVDDIQLVAVPHEVWPDISTQKVGAQKQLVAGSGVAPFTWRSSNNAVGVVAASGQPTTTFSAHAPGSAIVTVTDSRGITGAAQITVIDRSQITVNANTFVRRIPASSFGSSEGGYCNQAWGSLLANPNYVAAVRERGVTFLRFPNCDANIYDPRNPGGVTTDEIIDFAVAAGIPDLMLTANVTTLDKTVAADWVGGTRDRPVRVDYWELGNEIWDPVDRGLMTQEEYIRNICEWSAAMKAVDPAIKIGASVKSLTPPFPQQYWNGPILQQTAQCLDFLAVHPYVDVDPVLNRARAWDFAVNDGDGARANYLRVTDTAANGAASLRVSVTTLAPQQIDWQVQLDQTRIQVISGATYLLSFWAKASTVRDIHVVLQQGRPPWHVYSGVSFTSSLSNNWQRYTYSFTATLPGPDDPTDDGKDAWLRFFFGHALGDVWLDDISLTIPPSGANLVRNGGFEAEPGAFDDRTAQATFTRIWGLHPVSDLRGEIRDYAPARSSAIEIQASEWNLWYDLSDNGRWGNLDRRIDETLFEAVLGTDLFWDLVREGVDGAMIWSLVGLPWLDLAASPNAPRDAQHEMVMMNRQRSGPLLLDSRVVGPTYEDTIIDASYKWFTYTQRFSGIPYLSAYATKTDNGHKLFLIVTNKNSAPEPADITIDGFVPTTRAVVWQMAGPDYSDRTVRPTITAIPNAGRSFAYTFPARSVTNIELLTCTPTPTPTPTPTNTPTPTSTHTSTYTPSPTLPPTSTETPTPTPTISPTHTLTPTSTPTLTPTLSPTPLLRLYLPLLVAHD